MWHVPTQSRFVAGVKSMLAESNHHGDHRIESRERGTWIASPAMCGSSAPHGPLVYGQAVIGSLLFVSFAAIVRTSNGQLTGISLLRLLRRPVA